MKQTAVVEAHATQQAVADADAEAGASSEEEATPDEALLEHVPSFLASLKGGDASKRASSLETLAAVFRDKDSIDKYSNTLDVLCDDGLIGLLQTLWCANAQEDDASLPSALLLLARVWEFWQTTGEDMAFHVRIVERLLALTASTHEVVRVNAALAFRHGFSFKTLHAHGGVATLRR